MAEEITDERSDINIDVDSATASWNIRTEGLINGTYLGQFKFRCFLLPEDKLAAGRDERSLLGTNIALAVDNDRLLAYALSQLKYRVISSPPFWNNGNIGDDEVITLVLDAAVAAEIKYRDMLRERKVEALAVAKRAGEKLAHGKHDVDERDLNRED